jgi:hypothetical protein
MRFVKYGSGLILRRRASAVSKDGKGANTIPVIAAPLSALP